MDEKYHHHRHASVDHVMVWGDIASTLPNSSCISNHNIMTSDTAVATMRWSHASRRLQRYKITHDPQWYKINQKSITVEHKELPISGL